MRVMMTKDGFIENNRRRKGNDPAKDSFRLESLENFNPRVMVVVKATKEEIAEVEGIFEKRKKEKVDRAVKRVTPTAVVPPPDPEIRWYSSGDFDEPTILPDDTSDVKPEPTQYPMKKDKPKDKDKKEKKKDAPTGDAEVI